MRTRAFRTQRFRAPHILSLGFAGGLPADLIPTLAGKQIHVAARLGRMRISPHVYNDEADVDRFLVAMKRRDRLTSWLAA